MSRLLFAFALLLILGSCGGRYAPPSDVNDACVIVHERPRFLSAMERSKSRWGVPVAVQMAIIHQESKFVGNARTPYRWALGVIPMGRQSSAYGYAQVLDGTWDDYRKEAGRWGARRTDMSDATDFMGWYLNKAHEKLGISRADAKNLYLAYHEGFAGYARGSYRAKGWLLAVSDRVAQRAYNYEAQLISCGVM
ncbi:transglycosylase SLT domain-containing protein [Acidimangrovimonas sediminis]|uniref:transglycosylase SLT domain-containing protein n=1 Tax=Acidimangrovimonas sediminis TaxID=2056283 RepID=UPI000C80236B|nr:transglycosylase SLT domain-containing protein [Acidimangrovimonas sediminis]